MPRFQVNVACKDLRLLEARLLVVASDAAAAKKAAMRLLEADKDDDSIDWVERDGYYIDREVETVEVDSED